MITREDLFKIEDWLRQRSVKDTEFPTSDNIADNDKILIIQDGENKTAAFKDVMGYFDGKNFTDFYNVSKCASKTYLTLEQAAELVPQDKRKLGLVITFHNVNNAWDIFQFRGDSINQWMSVNSWKDLMEEPIIEDPYLPDEEDITKVNIGDKSYLKFKDKPVSQEEFSSQGIIILRRNIQNAEELDIDSEGPVNILKQESLMQPNTIYIIKYDFDLNGAVINMPEGCALLFHGGTLNNGTVYLNNTALHGVFKEGDTGTARIKGTFKFGQIMSRPELEATYGNEIRWYNGTEWKRLLDIDDYNSLYNRGSNTDMKVTDLIKRVTTLESKLEG